MPRDRGPRICVASGIYKDAHGYEASVKVGSGAAARTRAKRFPRDTGLRTMRQWQDAVRVALRLAAPPVRSGTLRADVPRYLKLVAGMPSLDARRAELEAWAAVFGNTRTTDLTTAALQAQLEVWRAAGRAASTLNHRRNSLAQLYAALYPTAPNPARGLRWSRPPDPAPRAVPPAIVAALLDAMPTSATKARLWVMAETGLPPVRVMRLTPADVDVEARTLRLAGRRKGRGTKGRLLPLSASGADAFRAFVAADAWGSFSSSGMSVSFRRAVAKVNEARAGAQLPPLPPLRPYDLRHSFGTRVYLATGDPRVAAELLDCSAQTALRYTLGAVPVTLQRAIAVLDGGQPPGPATSDRQRETE